MSFVLFLVWFAFSEADLLVESQLCGIVSPKGFFWCCQFVFVPSGFSDRRFETAPDLSLSKYDKWVLAKCS
ncbi:hypothetical protein D5E75_23320 [Vibrio parahaemolyticus]|nr:hypothetical protein D5E75_23320 [Vibrio parahaemolyticus]